MTFFKKNGKIKLRREKADLPGVIVSVSLRAHDFSVPRRVPVKGKVFNFSQFGKILSGRQNGQKAYEVLVNKLAGLPKNGILIIDLTGVVMMNSSFGDQCLGVLLENISQGHFAEKNMLFSGEIKQAVDFCLDRISEIRGVEIKKI